MDQWQPFAEANRNHEWANKDNTVTASLTSVAASSYTITAVPVASDWGAASLGTAYKLNSQMMLRAAISTSSNSGCVIGTGREAGVGGDVL